MPQPGAQMPPNMMNTQQDHGGHELFDAHEVIAGIISMLDQYQMYDQHIQDPELKDIVKRQTDFVTTMYNTIVGSFSTGHDPIVPTQQYKMTQNHTTTYGIKAGAPKKPNQSVQELSDKGLSAYMLGQTKSLATLLAMTALEMTNPVLRRVVADSVPNFIEMSYEIFLYQNKHGYYQVPQLNGQDMTLMLQSYTTVPQQNLPQ
ncbi:spore coat protein [Rossellomorea vietnamensis]|uniref:Spore coat protein n=2 Tax=Rossellomorea vietnamensis TaxID=218284 RepID=A0A6I6UXG4_9BACI|nr:spore coat protein [Rossellomorea vietnamensis]QHE63896.1 spore coat protein [Rossellomorea vietnamensis]